VTRLLLIRHGQAQSAVDEVVGGPKGCTGLSDLGRRQAAALRQRLERTGEIEGPVALYASILPRAIETAEIVAPALGDPAPAVGTQCELCEVHPGDEIDGMPWSEFTALYEWPPTSNPYRGWAPGAESWADFVLRVGRELNRLTEDVHKGGTVVVACHGGVIEAALIALADLPMKLPFRVQIDNTSITEWRLVDERWTLVRFNDAAHLAGVTG
jgi:probable phosphoglycerate mutase